MASATSNRAPAQINRRRLLSAIPAVAVLPAMVAVPAVAQAESPLRALYHRWQAAKDEYCRAFEGPDEDQVYRKMISIEDEAAAFDPQTVEDFAFKIIFADDNGDMNANLCQDALVVMAYGLAGLPLTCRIKSNRCGIAA